MSDARLRDLERQAAAGDPAALAVLQRERDRLDPPLAVFGSVCGNLEALESVLADMEQQGVGPAICLGGLVGYAPDPVACVDLVRARCEVVLMGRLDAWVVIGDRVIGSNRVNGALDWTRQELKPGLLSSGASRRRWSFLTNLPKSHTRGADLFVHGSARDPIWETIQRTDAGFGPTPMLTENFAKVHRLLFSSASHTPDVIQDDLTILTPDRHSDRSYEHQEGKAIVNVGSVGQPRDRDTRACYVILRGDRVTWRRVEYDVERTIAKIERCDGLDDRYGERLRLGI